MRFYWPIAKVDAEQRMVWGYASTEAKDDQGETVTRAALAAALDDYLRFANIREMHQPSAVGVAKEAAIDDKGLYLGAKIVDAEAWQKVVEGVYKGFSIGGRVTARAAGDRRVITGLLLTEISVVDRPANPEAVFDCWKRSRTPPAEAEIADDREPPGEPRSEPPRDGREAPPDHTTYADPGFQSDGTQRYPIDSERHIRAAWAFIHQPHHAARYTPAQLEQIKARIIAAWREQIDRDGPPEAGSDQPGQPRPAGKAGAAGGESPAAERLRAIIDDLCELLAAFAAEDGSRPLRHAGTNASTEVAAMALADALRKSRSPDLTPLAAGLARLADDIMPRLDALQKRVEDIAQTPLPPQTVSRGAVSGIAKREDGAGLGVARDDVVLALARMSDEERTLTLIKAAHANPLRR